MRRLCTLLGMGALVSLAGCSSSSPPPATASAKRAPVWVYRPGNVLEQSGPLVWREHPNAAGQPAVPDSIWDLPSAPHQHAAPQPAPGHAPRVAVPLDGPVFYAAPPSGLPRGAMPRTFNGTTYYIVPLGDAAAR